ncbi:MAG: MFS transporter [Phycisphaerales bacterium]|jgi:MFS family permease|nr:MFS transporter [Phycisphaerales bacterium]
MSATSSSDETVPVERETASDRLYHVGTLTYTRWGLFSLMAWLLWGDFVFFLMESVVPSILPLKLNELGASSTTIGLLITTLSATMNLIITPIVSFRSDRYRSRWGRRIPFLLVPTPMIGLLLVLLGYSESIGGWLAARGILSGMTASTVVIAVIAVLLIAFQFFNLFVTSVYWYLFNDVVPAQFLGRFIAVFRMVGLGAAGTYNLAVAPFAESHMREIFVVAAVVYVAVFGLMCLKVREGRYPPPPANVGGGQGLAASLRTYWTECFSQPLYWLLYASSTFWALSMCMETFRVFFFRSVGVGIENYFHLVGMAQWLTIPFLLLGGWFVDRFHPLKLMLIATVGLMFITPLQATFLFIDLPPRAAWHLLLASSLAAIPLVGLFTASEIPLLMYMLPRSRYGQFSSSNAMVRALAVIFAGLLTGVFLDMMGKVINQGPDAKYRFIPVWIASFQLLTVISLILLQIAWKRAGGRRYRPPGFEDESATL